MNKSCENNASKQHEKVPKRCDVRFYYDDTNSRSMQTSDAIISSVDIFSTVVAVVVVVFLDRFRPEITP